MSWHGNIYFKNIVDVFCNYKNRIKYLANRKGLSKSDI